MSTQAQRPPQDAPARVGRWPTVSPAVAALYVLVCLIWGSNWLAIKYAVDDMPPLLAAGLRFLVAGPILIAICRYRGVPLRFPPGLGRFAVFVTLGYFCMPFLLFNFAETRISAGLTAICFSTVSVLIVVLSVPVLGARLRPGQIIGVLVAFTALILLISRLQDLSAGGGVWGIAAALAAAVMHSFAYVNIKKYGGPVSALTLNTMPMIVAGLLLTGLSLVIDRPGADVFTLPSVAATVHLGVVASVIGLVAYFWLLQRLSATTASFVFIIFPVIAQVISVTTEGTTVAALDVLLLAVILGAFAWTQLSLRERRAAAGPEDEAPAEAPAEAPDKRRLQLIYAAAVRAYPEEACGFVRDSGVQTCEDAIGRPDAGAATERTARTGYAFDSADLLDLSRSFDTDDPVRWIYHSHPDVGAYFSAEDERFAVLDGEPAYPVDHLVVDVTADGVRGSRLFRFDRTAGRYLEAESHGRPHPLAEPVGASVQPATVRAEDDA